MKNRWINAVGVALSLAMLLLAFTISVIADEVQEVSREHEVTIQTSDHNSSYVYVDAEVPNGWGGRVDVIFQSLMTGKKETVTMSYLDNEYQTGIWLRFGKYKVEVQLPDDDGMCILRLKDPQQETLDVKKDCDIFLTVVASENPDYDFAPPAGSGFMETEETTAMPSDDISANNETTELPALDTTVQQAEESMEDGEHTANNTLAAAFLVALLVVIVLLAVMFALMFYHNQSEVDE